MGDADVDAERVGDRAQAALALQRQQRPRQRGRAEHRGVGPLQIRALERLAQDAAVERSVVGHHHAAAQPALELRQHRVGYGAPSTIAWVMPVKRWMPRRTGASVRTSEAQRS